MSQNTFIGGPSLNIQVSSTDLKLYKDASAAITLTNGSSGIDIHGLSVINAADPTNAQDLATKAYVDSSFGGAFTQIEADLLYVSLSTPLDQQTAATSNLSLNSHKITSLLDPTSAQDAATKAYVDTAVSGTYSQADGDARYYQNTVALNSITVPSGNVSLNSYKLVSVLDPTSAQDAATKAYVDSGLAGTYSQADGDARYYQNTVALNSITLASADVSLNSHKITSLANPVSNQDAVTKVYVDTAIGTTYLQTVKLNEIAAPTGSLSLNSQKIISLADPTNAQDAGTKAYIDTQVATTYTQSASDARYYQNTVPLHSITAPSSSVSLNSQKIVSLLDPVSNQDAATKYYVDQGLAGTYSQAAADARYYQQTVALNNITAPSGNLSLNSNKITSLSDPTLAQDAATKTYVDTQIGITYLNTVPLNQITLANGDVSLNSHKITSLTDPTLDQDASTKKYVDDQIAGTFSQAGADALYYAQTVSLDQITVAANDVSLNSHKLTLVSDPISNQDAATKYYVDQGLAGTYSQADGDARYYQNTVTINNISTADGDLSLNSHKITSLTDPTLDQDAATKYYVDQGLAGTYSQADGDARYYQNTVTLNSITAANGDLSLNSHKIIQLTDPTLDQDAATKYYVDQGLAGTYSQADGDARYYQQTVALNNLTLASGDLSLNSHKITSLTDPTLAQDAATKAYVDLGISGTYSQADSDARYYQNTVALNAIVVPAQNVDMNSKKMINLANATLATDAMNRQTGDGRYYGNTVTLNSITLPIGNVSLNSNKITDLSDATLGTDALNKQTADSRYYSNTVTLNNITAPIASVSLNLQKIVSLADGVGSGDAVNKGQFDALEANVYSKTAADARYYQNTVTLDAITAATSSVSLNSNKITNLAVCTSDLDASNKAYVDTEVATKQSQTQADSRYYQSTVALNSITAPSGDLSLNSHKITYLSDPISAQDAVTLNYLSTNYYTNTTALNAITAAGADLSLNSYKITNLANAASGTDALNRQTGDIRYYLNSTALNDITIPAAAVSLNSHKIINLLSGTVSTDAVNKGQLDQAIADLLNSAPGALDTLNELAAAMGNDPNFAATVTNELAAKLNLAGGTMTGAIAMGTYKLTSIGDATLDTDALNRQTADGRFYRNNVTLDSIIQPTGSVAMNAHKITALADPTLDQDATTKIYVDTEVASKQSQTQADLRYYQLTVPLNSITVAAASVSLNSQKITDLDNATAATDALNRQTGDGRYYLNTATLDNITLAAASLSLNSHKIVSLADATSGTDALNRQTGDGRYYLNTVTLDSITTAASDVSLNSHKLTNLAASSSLNDAMRLGDDLRYQWLFAELSADLTSSFTDTQTLIYDAKTQPVTNNVSRFVSYNTSTGVFTLLADHTYLVQLQHEVSYVSATNSPASLAIKLTDGTLLKSCITNRAHALGVKQLTTYQCKLTTTTSIDIKVILSQTSSYIAAIGTNSNISIKTLY